MRGAMVGGSVVRRYKSWGATRNRHGSIPWLALVVTRGEKRTSPHLKEKAPKSSQVAASQWSRSSSKNRQNRTLSPRWVKNLADPKGDRNFRRREEGGED